MSREQEHFGLKSSVCMGHSMGGGMCGMFAATFPECVDRLVMLDFVAFGEERHSGHMCLSFYFAAFPSRLEHL